MSDRDVRERVCGAFVAREMSSAARDRVLAAVLDSPEPGSRVAPNRGRRVGVAIGAAATLVLLGLAAFSLGHFLPPPNLTVPRSPGAGVPRTEHGNASSLSSHIDGTQFLYDGLPRLPLAKAQSLANPAIKLPSGSVAGEASAAVLLHDSISDAPKGSRLRIGLGVIYPGDLRLTAEPVSKERASQLEAGFSAAATLPTTATALPFLDGRAHVAELRVINGRRTRVERAGIQVSDNKVPGSVNWVDGGIEYMLFSSSMPLESLVAVAESIK